VADIGIHRWRAEQWMCQRAAEWFAAMKSEKPEKHRTSGNFLNLL
jgi:hypothetical protein